MAEPATSRKGIYRSRCTQNTQEFSHNAHIIQDSSRKSKPFFKEMRKKFCSTRFRAFRKDILPDFHSAWQQRAWLPHAYPVRKPQITHGTSKSYHSIESR